MEQGKSFESVARSFYGCDGGNLQSKIWFCGLEWGGDLQWPEGQEGKALITQGEDYGYQNESLHWVDYCDNVSWSEGFGDGLANGVNQKICWFLNYYLGLDRTDSYQYVPFVQQHEICFNTENGLGFKMNLFPLNAQKHDHQWDQYRAQYTGCMDRASYESWCIQHRGEFFRSLVAEHNPEVIIATGKTHAHKFMHFFGVPFESMTEVAGQEITIAYCKLPYSDTYLVISPFFGGASGINSFTKMQELAKLVHQIRGTESFDWS